MAGVADQYGINLAGILQTAGQINKLGMDRQKAGALAKYAPQVFDADPQVSSSAISSLAAYDPQSALQLSGTAKNIVDIAGKGSDTGRKNAEFVGRAFEFVDKLPDEKLADGLSGIKQLANEHGIKTPVMDQVIASGDVGKMRQFIGESIALAQSPDVINAKAHMVEAQHGRYKVAGRGVYDIDPEGGGDPKMVGLTPAAPTAASAFSKYAPQIVGAPGSQPPSGDALLKTLSPEVAAQVKAVAEGRAPYPTGFTARTPLGQAVLNALPLFDPNFEAGNYASRMKTRTDFMGGGKSAQNVKALNTAIGHAGTLYDQISGTSSANFTPYNAVANAFTDLTGGAGPQNFRQTAAALASELTTAFRGTGGAEADVVRQLNDLGENASREQKESAVRNAVDLLNSRLQALQSQYQSGMGTMQTPYPFISDKSKATMARIAPHASRSAAADDIPTVQTPAEAMRLPRGTKFRTPDGQLKVVP